MFVSLTMLAGPTTGPRRSDKEATSELQPSQTGWRMGHRHDVRRQPTPHFRPRRSPCMLVQRARFPLLCTGSNGTRPPNFALPIHTRGLCTHNSFLSSCVVAQGPSVTTIADPLVEWVERYTQQLGFEFSDEREMPYLFYCSGSTSRNVSSSQWTTMVHFGSSLPAFQPCSLVALLLQVKDAFAKFSPGNIGVPPKLLR